MTLTRLASLNIHRRPLASLTLILTLALAVAASSFLLRLYLISENRFATIARGGDAIIGAKSSEIEILLSALNNEGSAPGFMPLKLFQSLRRHQSIQFDGGVTTRESFMRSVIPIVHFAKYRDYRAIGTDDSFFERPHAEDSLKLAAGRLAAAEREIVVGYRVAIQESLKLGQDVELTRWVNDQSQSAPEQFKVVGVLAETRTSWDYNLFSTMNEAHRVLGAQPLVNSIWENQVVTHVLLYLTPDGFEKLEGLVNNRSVGQVVSINDAKNELRDLLGLVARLGFFVVGLILLVGTLAVCAVLINRFESQRQQTMLLRALGFQKTEICFWFLVESAMLTIIALVVGGFLESLLFGLFHGSLGAAIPTMGFEKINMLQLWPIWVIALIGTILGTLLPIIRFIMYGESRWHTYPH